MDNNTNISPGHIIRTRRPDPIPTQKTRFGSVPDPSKIPYWVALFKNRRTDTRSDLIRYPVGFPKNRKYANLKSLILSSTFHLSLKSIPLPKFSFPLPEITAILNQYCISLLIQPQTGIKSPISKHSVVSSIRGVSVS